jgi:serine protease Do
VNGTNVNTPDDVAAAIAAARKSGGGALALRIIRQGQALFIGIGLGDAGNDDSGTP